MRLQQERCKHAVTRRLGLGGGKIKQLFLHCAQDNLFQAMEAGWPFWWINHLICFWGLWGRGLEILFCFWWLPLSTSRQRQVMRISHFSVWQLCWLTAPFKKKNYSCPIWLIWRSTDCSWHNEKRALGDCGSFFFFKMVVGKWGDCAAVISKLKRYKHFCFWIAQISFPLPPPLPNPMQLLFSWNKQWGKQNSCGVEGICTSSNRHSDSNIWATPKKTFRFNSIFSSSDLSLSPVKWSERCQCTFSQRFTIDGKLRKDRFWSSKEEEQKEGNRHYTPIELGSA